MSTGIDTSATNLVDTTASAIVSNIIAFLITTRAEICLFLLAVCAHFLLFRNRSPAARAPPSPVNSKARKVNGRPHALYRQDDNDSRMPDERRSAQQRTGVRNESRSDQFVDNGNGGYGVDHREVIRNWSSSKRSWQTAGSDQQASSLPSGASLSQIVEGLQRCNKDTPSIVQDIQAYLEMQASDCQINSVNELLESLGRRMDTDLVDDVVKLLPNIGLRPNGKSYEILLQLHFMTRNFVKVEAVVAEMGFLQLPLTTRARIVVIKTALKLTNFDEALKQFKELRGIWDAPSVLTQTYSSAPRHIVSQLVDLACKQQRLSELVPELTKDVPVSEESIGVMLADCNQRKNSALLIEVEALARALDLPFTDGTYTLLVKGSLGDRQRVHRIFDELIEKGSTLSMDLVLSLVAYCGQTGDVVIADRLLAHTKPKTTSIISAFIRLYAEQELFEKACDVYENYLRAFNVAPEGSSSEAKSFAIDPRLERILMNAALRCGRTELAKEFLDSSPADVAKNITMIRNCAEAKNLSGAMGVFETLHKSGTALNSVVYNTVLDACVCCRDLGAAERWMRTTKEAGMADVVSYNTLIKAYLQGGHFEKARALMEDMRKDGFQPNRVTFNELVNATITRGGPARRGDVWELIDEMLAADVKPNQVTCSILLKSLNSYSNDKDIKKTMDVIDSMEEPMDEILLSSVVEACVRIGKPALLTSKLKQLQEGDGNGNGGIVVTGSHTFGSLIKAYGHAGDIDGVWRCWKEMRSRHVRPTSITLGCMVEAVVSNGDPEGAYELVHQMRDDEICRGALNAVIYCSVLKGFTREKKMERVLNVYEEMQQMNIEFSIVTYNTLIDACARSGRMEQVPEIILDMKKNNIKPNVITYSTMLKGHCQQGDIQMGFQIVDQMKKETPLRPDEIMYNSLLDGCAQNNLVNEGLQILATMQEEGVQPSNFTLSILVKLMNRARKLDQAFELVEDIAAKYRFRPNVHVYTNLVQACVSNRSLPRGMSLLEKMIGERVQPDNRTYAILIRANIGLGLFDTAITLLRASLGITVSGSEAGPLAYLVKEVKVATCPNLDHSLVTEAISGLAEKMSSPDSAVRLLAEIKKDAPWIRLDTGLQRRLMTGGGGGGATSFDSALRGKGFQGKGQGKGNLGKSQPQRRF